MKKEFKAAFPLTIPVMMGYLSVGIAFGLLFEQSGYGIGWVFFMSTAVYAGAMQFIAIQLLTAGVGFLEVGIVTLFVNLRHMFYGLSFIDLFNKMKGTKWYMIFALTDETYSLLCSVKPPDDVDKKKFYLLIAGLNQLYWVMGSLIGAFVGAMIKFDTTGLDFAMTALFVVIFIDQWKKATTHLPAMIGIVCTGLSLIIFGPNGVILPSMLSIALALVIFRGKIENPLSELEEA